MVSKIDKELLKLNHKKTDEYIDQLTDTSSKKKKKGKVDNKHMNIMCYQGNVN